MITKCHLVLRLSQCMRHTHLEADATATKSGRDNHNKHKPTSSTPGQMETPSRSSRHAFLLLQFTVQLGLNRERDQCVGQPQQSGATNAQAPSA